MTVKKLFVTDVTLRKMHDAGDFEFGFRDRLETAKLLDKYTSTFSSFRR